MKKQYRVKSNQEFSSIIKTGLTLKNKNYIVHIKKNELGYIRVGIAISSKAGNAVVRNQIKRRLRAICDSIIVYNNASFDIIIMARTEFKENSYKENKELLTELLKKYL